MRADAQRSLATLLLAAKQLFETVGVDVPVREIADKAGVGVGTLYRHFPRRSNLVVAVFRGEVDACADAAPVLAAQFPPDEALTRWMDRYVDFIATKRGLASALQSGEPAFNDLPGYLLDRLGPVLQALLDSGHRDGVIRCGVRPDELLYAVAGLCTPLGCGEPPEARKMVGLLLDGLRYRAAK